MIRYSFFSSICLSLRWVNVQLEGEKGSKQEWKKRSAEFTDRWLELGEVWPQMGWKCGGHEEFRVECRVELCCPTVPRSLGLSRLDGHLLGFLLRSYLGVLGRKPTTPAYLREGVFIVLCLLVYTCFSISFFHIENVRIYYDFIGPRSPSIFFLIRKRVWRSWHWMTPLGW